MSRWPIIFLIAAVVSVPLAYDRVSSMPLEAGVAAVSVQDGPNPAATNPPRIDGAWYCPTGSSSPEGWADHTINITNFAEEPAIAILNVVTADGRGPGARLELAPLSTERVKLSDYLQSEVAGAVVEIIGGEGVVGHTVATASGVAEGPCATEVSKQWYFADGRTEPDSAQYLALMNPFPEVAVYDLEVHSLTRQRVKRGQFVPARSISVVRVESLLNSEPHTAITLTTQQGRLVAERLQVVNGTMGPTGASLSLGADGPRSAWFFPAGRITRTGASTLAIYNPAQTGLEQLKEAGAVGAERVEEAFDLDAANTATLSIQLMPTDPADIELYGIATIERRVGPGGVDVVDLTAVAERHGFPLPYELAVAVQSDSELPVVAERWQAGKAFESMVELDQDDTEGTDDEPAEEGQEGEEGADGEQGGRLRLPTFDPGAELLPQPVALDGLSSTTGVGTFSARWLVPWATIEADSTVVVALGMEETSVDVWTLVNGSVVGPLRGVVPAGGRAVIAIPAIAGEGAPIEVVADKPVAVEVVVVPGGTSVDVVPAVPVVD